MKHLLFAIAIFIIASCTSCNSGSASRAANKNEAAIDNPTSTTTTGDAVFSYNLEGTKISGGEVDALAMNNAAWITKTGNGSKLSFFLSDAYKDNTETFSHSLRFAIPDKKGNTSVTADGDNWSIQLFLATGEDGKYVVYANESFTVTVTNISATRVSGTFSGKLKLVEGQRTGKNEFIVTDGKFDIPVRNLQK